MSLRIVLLMLLLQGPGAPGPESGPPGKGAIEGLVLAAGTNQPIENARVILDRADNPSRSMMTDSEGRFAFRDLGAGAYRLAFERNGYVRQEYDQRMFPGSGTTLAVAEGQELRNLVVRMTRAATISGRILDEDKQPVAGVPVQLMRSLYTKNGERELRIYGAAKTDDRGEYRLFFITPGRYYINAGTPQGPGYSKRAENPNEAPAAFASLYYPGVAGLQGATPLDIKAGAEISAIDWPLRRQQLFRIRGRVLDAATGLSPTQVEIWLRYLDLSSGIEYPMGQFGGDPGAYENGVFEFRDLMPGSYGLSATVRTGVLSTGSIPVEVVSSDLDGLVLRVSQGLSISGRVTIEGSVPSLAPFFQGANQQVFSVFLTPTVKGAHLGTPASPNNLLDPDGAFSIPDVLPGEYHVKLPFLPTSFYIKEARFDGTDVLSGPLHFSGEDSKPSTLDILLSSSVGALTGSVTSGEGSAAGTQVVLVPNRSRHRSELFRAVMTNQDGRFSIANIVPGDYRVYAWEAIEPNAWFDPEVLARDEPKAKSVRVAESSMQTIEVGAIASP